MIFITTYKIKPFLSKDNQETVGGLCQRGCGPRHNSALRRGRRQPRRGDRRSDDIEAAYRNIQNYTQWVEYDTKVMLTVEKAVPLLMDALG